MMDFDEMTLSEAADAIRRQKERVDKAAYWNYDHKVELMRKYEKLQNAINYLWDNLKYFNDYNFMNEELIKIGQEK